MMNPFEFRDLMNAAYGWTDETPEQVTARYKTKSEGRKKAKSSEPQFKVSKGEKAKFEALLAKAKPREKPKTE